MSIKTKSPGWYCTDLVLIGDHNIGHVIFELYLHSPSLFQTLLSAALANYMLNGQGLETYVPAVPMGLSISALRQSQLEYDLCSSARRN